MKKKQFCFSIGLLFCLFYLVAGLKAQVETSLMVGTKVPLMYSVGAKIKLSSKFSTSLQAGIITKPFDNITVSLLDAFDKNNEFTEMIGSSFSIGYVVEPTLYYEFSKKYYVGGFGNWMHIRSTDGPQEYVKSFFTVNSDNEFLNEILKNIKLDIQVTSTLYTAGLLVGRKFFIKESKFHFCTELAFAKSFGSSSKLLLSGNEEMNSTPFVDSWLKDFYKKNGYFPTLNLYVVYRLNKKDIVYK